MGLLQPGTLVLSSLSKAWLMIVIDLKDWFFSNPLYEQDKEKLAFSIPINIYQSIVLQQGMLKSPTLY